ncbi:MAG: VTT domain-containing protein [Hydrogenothermaceae bacterium]|nr:VTT domain-containing protein [Hydrogenothermaceae bacterium]
MLEIVDFILHLDKYLSTLAQSYGSFIYFLLFLIIFAETGFVITPILPGDSLLFVVGSFCAVNILDVRIVYPALLVASITGNTINYFIGLKFGRKILENTRLINPKYIEETEKFFAKYGSKAVVISRFLPFFRTFVPFFAGVGKMDVEKYLFYNVLGGLLWITGFIFAGYFFGNIPFVKDNFTLFIYGIIVLTVLPGLIKIVKR